MAAVSSSGFNQMRQLRVVCSISDTKRFETASVHRPTLSAATLESTGWSSRHSVKTAAISSECSFSVRSGARCRDRMRPLQYYANTIWLQCGRGSFSTSQLWCGNVGLSVATLPPSYRWNRGTAKCPRPPAVAVRISWMYRPRE